MVDTQDTTLHYFIYMRVVQASSVSTTTCIDHHVFMVSFLSEMNYFPTLGLFFQWEKNQLNVPNNLFHLSKISIRMFYLTLYQFSGPTSLDSFVYDSFVKKVIPKNILYFFNEHLFKQIFLKKPCRFRSVIKCKSIGTQVSINEKVPDLLLLEKEVCSVISSVETEVSKYELATNLAIWDSDSDLDMDDIICDVGNDF